MGKSFTLAVYDKAGHRRSLEWRFKANKSDVYVGAHAMGQHKLSLHPQEEGGYSAWAFTAEYWPEVKGKVAQQARASIIWHRPAPTPSDPVVSAIRVLIPGEDPALDALEPPPPDDKPAGIKINAAAWGRAVAITVGMSLLGPDLLNAGENVQLFHIAALKNGEHAYLIVTEEPFAWSSLKLPATPASVPFENLFDNMPVWPNRMRATLHGVTDDGLNFVLDVPIFPPDVLTSLGLKETKLFEFQVSGDGDGE